MPGIPRDNPITMREKLIREVYYEKLGKSDDSREIMWEGPISVRLEELKKKMHVYEQNMSKKRDRYLKEQEIDAIGGGSRNSLSEMSLESTGEEGRESNKSSGVNEEVKESYG